MKAIALERPGKFVLIEQPEITEAPRGQAIVRVRRVGICGTDWHAFHGRQPFFSYPRVLGHELAVEIESVNDSSSDLAPGDRCSVEPYLNCGRCIACRRGKGNCCTDLKVLGVHTDGGMRERIALPVNKLHRSNGLSLDQLALVETLGIGCHAVSRAQLEPGEQVLVLGAGPIGLSVLPFVIASGAIPTVADISAPRLDFCRNQMKIQNTIDANGNILAQLRGLPGGELPTAVIDATGNPQSMSRCFDLVAPGGRIVFVGLFPGDLTFNDPNFHRREIALLASRNALPGDFQRIIGLIADGKVDTDPWITHRAGVDEFLQSLPGWLTPQETLIKAMVEF